MNDERSVTLYRALLRCYPRRFRDEYGADMAQLFAEQLRDEPRARVWARAAIDLAITAPAQHLEAHMHRTNRPVTGARSTTAHWWKLAGGGALTLTILFAVTAITGELPDGFWLPVMTLGLIALLMIGAGAILGVVRLTSRGMPRS